jgi:glycerol uptake facilitator protein
MHTSSLLQRAAAEFIGVFLMASIGLMTVATAITTGSYGLFELSIAFALTIMVIVIVVGAYSGAHVNPAITIALATYDRFPWREVPAYVAAQISGGVAGASVLYGLYAGPIRAFEAAKGIVRGAPDSAITAMIFNCYAPNPAIAGANNWGPGFVSTPMAVAAEAFSTFVLALVLFLMLDPKNGFAPSLKSFSLIIGGVVGFIIMVEAPLTMAGINPARDLGPRIATWIFGWGSVSFPGVGPAWWVWTVGPILGALAGGGVAVLMSRFLQLHRQPEPVEESSPLREAIEPIDHEVQGDTAASTTARPSAVSSSVTGSASNS